MKSKPVKGFFVKKNNPFLIDEGFHFDFCSPTYILGIDTYDRNIKSYCLARKNVNGEIEILLQRSTSEDEFKKDVEDLARLFNTTIMSEFFNPKETQYTHPDTERLDKLQRLTTGYGKGWILRDSFNGRGMRLHETSQDGAYPTVRKAIDAFDEREKTHKDT